MSLALPPSTIPEKFHLTLTSCTTPIGAGHRVRGPKASRSAPRAAAPRAAPAAASTKGKTVIIHGQAHDVDENVKQAEEEERLWKLEKGQIKAKDVLETAIAKIWSRFA